MNQDKIDTALRHLVKATDALLTPTVNGKAAAILYMAMAMACVAQSDPDEAALTIACDLIRRAQNEDHS